MYVKNPAHAPVCVHTYMCASGLSVFLQYKEGSSRQGKGSAKYRVPDMAWVGLRPSQLEDLDLPEQARPLPKREPLSSRATQVVDGFGPRQTR